MIGLTSQWEVTLWLRTRDYMDRLLSERSQKNHHEEDENEQENAHSVSTWKPLQTSPIALMRRYFLGGCQLLMDSSYLVVNSNAE
ncbi:hypothetical protein SK128_004275, partial [Halocaridina rubra]